MAANVADRELICCDCNTDFLFTIAEQHFYAERAVKPPVRCPACRAERRAERNGAAMRQVETSSGYVPSREGYGNLGGFAGSSGGRRNGRTGVQTFTAVCSACGREAELPFAPRGNRPVYCRTCFAERKSKA